MITKNKIFLIGGFILCCFLLIKVARLIPEKRCSYAEFYNNLARPSTLPLLKPQNQSLPLCPEIPPNLVGPIEVITNSSKKIFPHFINGHGHPSDCKARNKVAIIIPFRNRESHLKILLQNLHPFLEKQQIDYSIFVVEQISNSTFNKAKLMNAGFIEASKMYDWDCFIFHDVDLIPENDQNIYSCPENPRHMSVYVSKFNYELPYSRIMGGVVGISGKHFVETNGYSNSYWGWGGEDDDFYNRIVYGAGFEVTRYSGDEIPKYKSIDHGRDQGNHANPCVFTIMEDTRFRYRCDGLSNCNYKIISSTIKHLYNHFFVDVLEKESRERLHAEKKVYKNC